MGTIETATVKTATTTTMTNYSNGYSDDKDLVGKDGKVLVDRLLRSVGETHAQNEKDMDAFLAGELNKMSLGERQRVFEEIHGVQDHIIEETPDFISKSLEALELEVSKLQPKVAYDMAKQINPTYVHNDSFRLTFLRADLFDPIKAAKRMITFFECRLALFGPNLLTRSLTLDDLNDDDKAAMNSGYFQILASRDTSGRTVFANVQGMFKRSYKLALNMQRTMHYMMCTMVEDMDSQLHGSVYVMYQIGSFEYDPPPDLFKGGTTLMMKGSPIRVSGVHMCLDHPIMKAISRVVLAISGQEARIRYRLHEGSHTEVQYRLQSFGIPVELLPITSAGELKKGNHMKWLAMRKAKESTKSINTLQFASSQHSNDLRVELPGRYDVLLGKGKVAQQHSGNVSMRALVALHLPEYNASSKHTKSTYTKKVRAIIDSQSGRFLKKHPSGWWIMASEDEIKEKLSKAFTATAAKAKRSKKKSVQQNVNSSNSFNPTKRSRDDEFCVCFGNTFTGICGDENKAMIESIGFGQDVFSQMPKRQKSPSPGEPNWVG